MGFGNMGGGGGIAEILGQLVSGVAQYQGNTPQDVLAQRGVTEADIQPENLNQQGILQSLMGFVQQNPQIVMLVASQIPALRGLLGGGGIGNNSAGGGLAGMLGGLLGGGQSAQPGQQGGDMLGGLGGLLGGLMGGGQAANPNAAAADASEVPSSAPTGDAMNQLLGALLSGQRQ